MSNNNSGITKPPVQDGQTDIIQEAIDTIRKLKAERAVLIEQVHDLQNKLECYVNEIKDLKSVISAKNVELVKCEKQIKAYEQKQSLIDELKKEIVDIQTEMKPTALNNSKKKVDC